MDHMLYAAFLTCACAGCLCGQSSASTPRPAKAAEAQIIALKVPIGTPIQVALDREVRIKGESFNRSMPSII